MKKYLCSIVVAATLVAQSSADELYVRNKVFKDTYNLGGATYVPVAGFLRATNLSWSGSGSKISLGSGDSSESAFSNQNFTLTSGKKTLDVAGVMRGNRLYAPLKELAKFVGYSVVYNKDTGIIDVIKARDITADDEQAAEEVAAANQAEQDAIKAKREARQAKEKAAAEAKAAKDGKGEAGETEVEGSETKTAADESSAKPAAPAVAPAEPSSDKQEKPKEPPKANLVVLSSDADPNYYTGECKFRAVIQNQGYAPAQNLTAALTVTGPDGRVLISKTLYHAPLAIDSTWEIVESYKHPLQSAMPRGDFKVSVTPKYTSAVVAEQKK